MKLDDIYYEWEKDSEINRNELGDSTTNTLRSSRKSV